MKPRRREILDVLAAGELCVSELVEILGIGQPLTSKHLRVLREADFVNVRSQGRQWLYRLDARPLQPIHDWVKPYERTWSARLDRFDKVVREQREFEQNNQTKEGQRDTAK